MKSQALVLLSSLVCAGSVMAQTKAPEPDYTLSYNVGVVSDYRYRGISQTAKKPALQGGVDYANKNGLYVGTWLSTIRWIKDSSTPVTGPSAKGPLEWDIYGGYKGAINDTFSYDVGGLYYWYTGNTYKNISGENANTFELYGALSAGPATLKYSHSLTPLFGTPNSKNSGYLDLSATFDLGNGFSLVPHVGWQKIRRFDTYMDYSLTVAKDFDGLVVSAGVVGTNWKSAVGSPYTLPGSGTRDLGKAGLVVGLKKTF